MKSIRTRILHLLIALDQFVFSLCSLGGSWPDETISAACWRLERDGKKIGIFFRPIIDFIFSPLEEEHCYESYMSEVKRSHLPDDY